MKKKKQKNLLPVLGSRAGLTAAQSEGAEGELIALMERLLKLQIEKKKTNKQINISSSLSVGSLQTHTATQLSRDRALPEAPESSSC